MRREAGFSLIEMLAALAVLAIAGAALTNALTTTVRSAALSEEAALAAMAAETVLATRIVEARGAPLADRTGAIELAGRSYDWTLDVGQSGDPGLDRIELTVSRDGRDQATLETFVRSGAAS
ncbi:MAG: type II secretion system minor pseudopilin GspI [Oceanicaulis sp.]